MKLNELLTESPNTEGVYEPQNDNRVQKTSDTRKPKLTLKHLNRLRKYKKFKQQELERKHSVIAVVYSSPEEDGGMGGEDLGI